jgi:predicted Fe-Mo cluster-binding NifX family protein
MLGINSVGKKESGRMNIAIPIWEKGVSPVLDTAARLLVVESAGNKETSRHEVLLDSVELVRRCEKIQNLKIDVLICGALSKQFEWLLLSSGLQVIAWVSGKAEEILEAYLHGKIYDPKFLMPGCDTSSQSRRRKMAHSGGSAGETSQRNGVLSR